MAGVVSQITNLVNSAEVMIQGSGLGNQVGDALSSLTKTMADASNLADAAASTTSAEAKSALDGKLGDLAGQAKSQVATLQGMVANAQAAGAPIAPQAQESLSKVASLLG